MRVLVAGASGFIGRALVDRLLTEGCTVDARDRHGGPLTENSPIGPLRPYGLSKQLCENWALSVRERPRVQIVRAFNQVGPGMAPGLLIPDVLERMAAATKARSRLTDATTGRTFSTGATRWTPTCC